MISPAQRKALELILDRLEDAPFGWALTGSLGMALQGMPVSARDIDLQCDEAGAYGIPDALPEYVTQPTAIKESDLLRSHFGRLRIGGAEVEVMGSIQSRAPGGGWNAPVDLPRVKHWAPLGRRYVPVLSLAYEAGAYERIGRAGKAALLARWAAEHPEERVEAVTNYQVYGETLAGGGQPLPAQIEALGRQRFSAVVNLALPDSVHALRDEADLVAAQGMEYLPLPVEWTRPTGEQLERFFALLDARRERKVFVHCVLNMRASAFIFLYRTLRLGQPVPAARAALQDIWTPNPTWEAFIRRVSADR